MIYALASKTVKHYVVWGHHGSTPKALCNRIGVSIYSLNYELCNENHPEWELPWCSGCQRAARMIYAGQVKIGLLP